MSLMETGVVNYPSLLEKSTLKLTGSSNMDLMQGLWLFRMPLAIILFKAKVTKVKVLKNIVNSIRHKGSLYELVHVLDATYRRP